MIELGSALQGIEAIAKTLPAKTSTAQQSTDIPIDTVLAALNSFTDIVRYLNTRRSTGAVLDLSNEAAVQDVLYMMLRPLVLDLTPETPTEKVANRFSIRDFASPAGRFVIEAKYVRDQSHGKSLGDVT